MNAESNRSESLFHLLTGGEAADIFLAVNDSATECLESLGKARKEEEIEEDSGKEIQANVEQEMEEGKEIKFSLAKIDNVIKKESQSNIVLRRFIQAQKSMRDKPMALFYNLLASDDKEEFFSKTESLNQFRSNAIESFRYRIKFTSCWDNILTEYRRVLVACATMTGHKLSAIALQMQDDDTIVQVRDLLEQLDLDIPQETRFFSLPRQVDQLQTLLIQGIQTIEKQHQKITEINKQREELTETHDKLEEVVSQESDFEQQEDEPKPKMVKEKGNVTRMIYPHHKNSGKGRK